MGVEGVEAFTPHSHQAALERCTRHFRLSAPAGKACSSNLRAAHQQKDSGLAVKIDGIARAGLQCAARGGKDPRGLWVEL